MEVVFVWTFKSFLFVSKMSQPSVINYFSTRKRVASDDLKSNSAKKVLVLDNDSVEHLAKNIIPAEVIRDCRTTITTPKIPQIVLSVDINKPNQPSMAKKPRQGRIKKIKEIPNQRDIQTLLSNVGVKTSTPQNVTSTTEVQIRDVTPINEVKKEPVHITPPSTPVKRINALDKVKPTARELSFNELKQKMSRSSRLAELKASISKFKQLENKLESAESKTSSLKESPNLKSFRTLELEVALR